MRMGGYAVAAGLLATALVAPPSHAAAPVRAPITTPAVTGQVRSLDDYVARGFSVADATVVRRLDTLAAGGVPKQLLQLPARRDPTDPPCTVVTLSAPIVSILGQALGEIVAVGDINGDGRGDVIENRNVARTSTTNTWVVKARDARSGRVLWTRQTVLARDHWGFALPMKAAPGARPVVMLLAIGAHFEGLLVQKGTVDDSIAAVDGAGRDVWHRVDSGRVTYSVTRTTYEHAPLGLTLTGLHRDGNDVLVHTFDTGGAGVTGRLIRVAGATGHADQPYPAINGAAAGQTGDPAGDLAGTLLGPDDTVPDMGVLPDQDSDRLPDVFTARLGQLGTLSAYGGLHGNPLWSNQALPLSQLVDIRDAGLLTAGELRRHDLAVTTAAPVGSIAVTAPVVGDIGQVGAPALIMLVGGGTGLLQWARLGDQAYPLQHFGSPATPALGVVSTHESHNNGPYQLRLTVDVLDAQGLTLSSHDYTYTSPDRACHRGRGWLTDLDDADSDGSLEAHFFYYFDGFADGKLRYWDTAVRGRDGAVLDHSSAWAAYGPLDGHGDDRVHTRSSGDGSLVTASHGDRLKAMWTAWVPAVKQADGAGALATPATSKQCQDVGVRSYDYEDKPFRLVGDASALIASNGKPWWTIAYGEHDLTGDFVAGHGARALC